MAGLWEEVAPAGSVHCTSGKNTLGVDGEAGTERPEFLSAPSILLIISSSSSMELPLWKDHLKYYTQFED